jgi:hypothetical protein
MSPMSNMSPISPQLQQWSDHGIHLIKDIKKSILKKKIMMSFVIDSNSWYDKIFRYIHLILGVSAVVIGAVNQNLDQASSTSPVLTAIVVAMIKMKDYLKFDKNKDAAKRQTVKYEQLFQRIDREILKSNDKRQTEDEFLMQINREFNSIEIEDPDIPRVLKEKYIALCKANNIQYDEDLEALQELVKEKHILFPVQPNNSPISTPCNNPHIEQNQQVQHNPHVEQKTTELPVPSTTITINKPRSSLSITRSRTASDEAERVEYKEKIKTVDTQQDLQWAIERLDTLNQTVKI